MGGEADGFIVIIWIVSIVLGGIVGSQKNRTALGILLGVLLGLIGVLIIAVMDKKEA